MSYNYTNILIDELENEFAKEFSFISDNNNDINNIVGNQKKLPNQLKKKTVKINKVEKKDLTIKENNMINPFELFGLDLNSSMKDLKKMYYSMALIVHPDKGGEQEEMNVLANAYKYVKEQLEYKNNDINEKSLEELEEKFYDFCKKQEAVPMPKFAEIYEETNDWIHYFNKEFEEGKNNTSNINNLNPYGTQFGFNAGYGDLMDKSNINENMVTNDINGNSNIKYDNRKDLITKPRYEFKREIIQYKGDDCYNKLRASSNCADITGKKIKDFSGDKCYETDYMVAFSSPEEIEDVRNFTKTNSQVMKEYESLLQERLKEMELFKKEIN